MRPSRAVLLTASASAALVLALVLRWSSSGDTASRIADKPISITPGPAGLVSGTAPTQSGTVWLLASTLKGANLQRVRIRSGRVLGIVPLPKEASVLAESAGGYLGVGVSPASAGAVEFLSSTGGAAIGTVPVSGRVLDLVAGVDGTTFYAATQSRGSRVLDVISIPAQKVMSHVPLPAHTVSVAVTADQTTLFALESNGSISVIDIGTSRVTDRFPAGPDARHIAITPDGSRLLVLKGALNSNNVSVLDITKQSTISVLPAPANTRWIVATSDSAQVVNFVGTTTMGNVQAFLLP